MEQVHTNDLLKQMESYNFEAPIKVSLLFEEDEAEELRLPVDNNAQYNNISRSVRVCSDLSTNPSDICSPDICFNYISNGNDIAKQVPVPVENYISNQGSSLRTNGNLYQPHQLQDTIVDDCIEQHKRLANKLWDINKSRILRQLDEVSYNLTEISKYYFYNSMANLNNLEQQQATIHYYTFKERYFRLSYNTVCNIFLPRENNHLFIEHFIRRTTVLAKQESSSVFISYLRNLVTCLIAWTKQEEEKYKNEIRPNGQKRSRDNNVTHQIPIDNIRLLNSNGIQSKENNNEVCLFKVGPQNQEIRITCNPDILNNTANLSKKNCSAKSDFKSCNFNKRSYNLEHQRMVYENCVTNTLSSTQSTVLPYQNNNAVESSFLNSENEFSSRSSISRDSGFISPAANMYPHEQMMTNSLGCSPAHLTANFNTPIRTCAVCSSNTRLMCTGCFNVYYCSIECQKNDYIVHEFLCRKTQT